MNKILLKIGIILLPLTLLATTATIGWYIQGQIVHNMMIVNPDGGAISDTPYWVTFILPWISLFSMPVTTYYSIKLWIKYIHHG